MSSNIFQDHARRYYENGYSVIPLVKDEKRPFFLGWEKYCRRLPTDAEVTVWEDTYHNKNIGLACGEASQVVAIDIDTDDLIKMNIIDKILPPCPVRKKGKKGETRFYRYSGESNWKLTIEGEDRPVVELLSTGNQTVLPPSIHPETKKPYTWTTPLTLRDTKVEDLSPLPKDLQEKLKAALQVVAKPRSESQAMGTGGRNQRLKNQAIAALLKGKEENEIVQELYAYDLTKHTPPYFSDSSETQMKGKDPRENALKLVQSLKHSLEKRDMLSGVTRSVPAIDKTVLSGYEVAIGESEVILFAEALSEATTQALGLISVGNAKEFNLSLVAKKNITVCLSQEKENTLTQVIEAVISSTEGSRVYVALLPNGIESIEQLIKEKPLETFRELINAAQAHYLYFLSKRFDLTDQIKLKTGELDDKDRDLLLEDVVKLGSQVEGPIEKDLFTQAAVKRGELLGVTKESLYDTLERLRYNEETEKQKAELRKTLDRAQALVGSGREQEAQELLSKQGKQLNTGLLEASYRLLTRPITEDEIRENLKRKPDSLDSGFTINKENLLIPSGAITIIAAPTSHGKTTFLINLALNLLKGAKSKPVYLFSYEENREAILLKTLNTYIGKPLSVNNRRSIEDYFKTGEDTFISTDYRGEFKAQKDAFFKTLVDSGKLNVHYDSHSVEELVGAIKHLHKHAEIGAVLIDYMQLLRLKNNPTNSRQEELKQVCLDLKDCAVETGLPIILGAQFNRTVTSIDKLHATAIGEAGDIERIANLIIGFWNKTFIEVDKNNSEPSSLSPEIHAVVLKGRDMGAGGTEIFNFDGNTGKISNKEIKPNIFNN